VVNNTCILPLREILGEINWIRRTAACVTALVCYATDVLVGTQMGPVLLAAISIQYSAWSSAVLIFQFLRLPGKTSLYAAKRTNFTSMLPPCRLTIDKRGREFCKPV
jgi:hypothetical protein